MKYTGQQMSHLLYYNLGGDFRAYPEWSDCDYSAYETKAAYSDCPKDIYKLRLNEMITYPIYAAPYEESDASADDWLAMCWVSNKPYAMVEAFFSIFLTICIAALLGVMAYLFSRDADMMVIKPIESMVDSVTKLAANPAYKLEAKKEVKYETDALYVSLAKIAQLLQVGFGEAGNNLVAENLKKGDTVDPMVPGKMLLGAYGFCIIDDYEEVRSRRDLGLRCDLGGAWPRRDLGAISAQVLECLGEEILPFTNTAANIVHDAVTGNGGQPNRNLGEAFLCVWKPHTAETDHEPTAEEQRAAETKMCDGALTAFRTCVRKVTQSGKLQARPRTSRTAHARAAGVAAPSAWRAPPGGVALISHHGHRHTTTTRRSSSTSTAGTRR